MINESETREEALVVPAAREGGRRVRWNRAVPWMGWDDGSYGVRAFEMSRGLAPSLPRSGKAVRGGGLGQGSFVSQNSANSNRSGVLNAGCTNVERQRVPPTPDVLALQHVA